MRTHLNCPFLPGSGQVPEVWAGRELELADAEAVARRRSAGVYERSRAVLGEYGIGKSVLVNRIAADFAAEGHWVPRAVRVSAGEDPVPVLAAVVGDLIAEHSLDGAIGRRASGLLDRVAAINLPVIGGGVELRGGAPELPESAWRDVGRLVEAVGGLARDAGRLVVLRIDEVQNATTPGLSRLLTLLADVTEATVSELDVTGTRRERVLPLVVLVSGLPDFRDRAAEAGSTFARRFKIHELELLDEAALRTALHAFTADGWPVLTDEGPRAVHMAPEAVDLIVERCLGDPFLFQLAGEAAWNAGTGPLITGQDAARGWQMVRRETVRYVEGRLGGVSDLQVAVLRAAGSLADLDRTGDAVATAMGRSGAAAIASTLQSLDRTHRLIRREAGRVSFRSEAVRRFLAGDWP